MTGARTIEVWVSRGGGRVGQEPELAQAAEAAGFDGINFGDTQCMLPDPYVTLAAIAGATTRLKLGVRVTNPVTRHPAATACAIASVQLQSAGRAVLGIGRGFSSLEHVGLPIATVAEFERYLTRLQGYLAGEVVDANGVDSALTWLSSLALPKVPVDVAATGPAVIAVGARLAEAVTFSVSAEVKRVAHAISLARRAREEAGLDPATLSLGVYVNLVADDDRHVALAMAKGGVAMYAHFSGMPGYPTDSLDSADAEIIKDVSAHYDVSRHARSDASHTAYVDDAFVERFGIVGTPDHCVERLLELVNLGVERFAISGASPDSPPARAEESRRFLAEAILPALRRNAVAVP